MKPKKYFFVMLAVFLLLILAILGATIGGNALLQKESKKLTELKVQDKATEQQKSALAQAKKDIEKYKELETISKSIVPQDKDQAKTVREITKIAEDSGIRLKSFVFQSSNLGQAPVAAPKPAENESNASAPGIPSTGFTWLRGGAAGVAGALAFDSFSAGFGAATGAWPRFEL
jgi:hypothetical protein